MNWFKVGVMPRVRKSARKPSREMRIVVGAKVDVPFERRDRCAGRELRVTLYAPNERAAKSAAMNIAMICQIANFWPYERGISFIPLAIMLVDSPSKSKSVPN